MDFIAASNTQQCYYFTVVKINNNIVFRVNAALMQIMLAAAVMYM